MTVSDQDHRSDRTGTTDRADLGGTTDRTGATERPDRTGTTDPVHPTVPVPAPGAPTTAAGSTAAGSTAAGTGATAGPAFGTERPARSGSAEGDGSPVLPTELSTRLTERLDRAVGGFVDDPRAAVQEADGVLEEAMQRLADGLRERRTALGASWRSVGGADRTDAVDEVNGRVAEDSSHTDSHTEALRLSLREYRDLLRRVLAL
ncbi:hypothetical protein [Kitasatospora sp. NPDC088134]|uniref:hypothetical protein n=1 Tax=Kitasatospora sp. NPDC088134 TaxID=3364071 RepID=UPI0037F46973